MNIFEFSKLIGVFGLHVLHKRAENLELPFLPLDTLVHLFEYLEPFLLSLVFIKFFFDFINDDLL